MKKELVNVYKYEREKKVLPSMRSMQFEPERQREAAQYIFTEAKRVETLSQKLLSLMGLSHTEISFTEIELKKLFHAVGSAVTAILGDVPLKIQNAQNIYVVGDFDLLCDLLYNLIHNAVKAKPKDGITCMWKQKDGFVTVIVEDTGCGIPAGKLSLITEPFYMVDKSRARAGGGSGMGLALCDKIAQKHGTRLIIKSVVGKGTAVSFTLRAAEVKNG